MSTYNFSMESVLEWRSNKEKSTMEKFAILQNEMLHHKAVLHNLKREYEGAKEKSMNHKNIQELRHHHYYQQILAEKIEKQIQVIHKITEKVELARLDLISAQKDRKIMEKLKEKDFTLYKDNIKTLEQKELDEMAVLSFKKPF